MKSSLLFLGAALLVLSACAPKTYVPSPEAEGVTSNPFFSDWGTPFETPDFSRISEDHYVPAIKEGIKQEQAEVDVIIANQDEPTFENTIAAMEGTGALLNKVSSVFFVLNSSVTNDNMQAIAKEISPLLSEHGDNIRLDKRVFARVKAVYEKQDQLDLTPAQARLVNDYYKGFVRAGANLPADQKEELRGLNKELAALSLKFGENVLAETNNFEMVIENEADLAGLPESVIANAAEAAKERGHEGKWVFTQHRPSVNPFLTYSERRDLREKMYKGYNARADNGNDNDNKETLAKIAALRVTRANLLGFPTHADYVLDNNMAKTPANVYDLLNKVWEPALKMAKQEVVDMQEMIDSEGGDFKLAAWDWRYYAEKVRKARYDLDDEELRPYFKMENVRQGVFDVANKLYGITFTERTDISKYHEDVVVFEVKEADGTHIGIFYTDYFPRASKRGGAWMNSFRGQSNLKGDYKTPVILNTGNLSKPVGDKPALISFGEASTLFHEFGHALHGLLSDGIYPSQTGTSVARDFVEMFSQIMENWATEPEVMKSYARHYETNEPIPDELIEKIIKSSHFNQGFATIEYLAASYLDMNWHTLTEAVEQDVTKFEDAALAKLGLIDEIESRYRSTFFNHIFAGGYSSGYYSYLWAEVLDADAFEAFKETSLFDPKTAASFRENLLSKGDSEDPMVLYRRFRGADPSIDPLLKRRGFAKVGN